MQGPGAADLCSPWLALFLDSNMRQLAAHAFPMAPVVLKEMREKVSSVRLRWRVPVAMLMAMAVLALLRS